MNKDWIEIKSREDLPKQKHDIQVFLFCNVHFQVGIGYWNYKKQMFKTRFENEYENVTHYMIIEKPNPPKI